MKTLTVEQPWASLLVRGVMKLWNCDWMPEGRLPGAILIHAGAEGPRAGEMEAARGILRGIREREVADWRGRNPGEEVPSWKGWDVDPCGVLEDLPRGCIVGMVEVYDVVVGPVGRRGVTNGELRRWELDPWGKDEVYWGAEWWSGAGKGWRFTAAVALPVPVPVPAGGQGLWECEVWPEQERLRRLYGWRQETLAGLPEESDLYWLEDEAGGDCVGDFCGKCIEGEREKLRAAGGEWVVRSDGGCHHEVESLTHCEGCGARIGCCLTDYGMEEETKWLVNDGGAGPLDGEDAWLLERCDLPVSYLLEGEVMVAPVPGEEWRYDHSNHRERKRMEAEWRAGLKVLAVVAACGRMRLGGIVPQVAGEFVRAYLEERGVRW